MIRFPISLLLLMSLLGSGCAPAPAAPPREPNEIQAPRDNGWVPPIGDGVSRREIAPIILYRFPRDAFSWQFQYSREPKLISEWAGDRFGASVFNGTYFSEDYSPTGFLVHAGSVINERRFDLNRSGIISLSPSLEIIDTAETSIDFNELTEAAQSFPFLLKHGKPAIENDSGLVARRTFLGTDGDGMVYIGIVPHNEISLYKLMEKLIALDISWDHVINLDGGPSSGMFVNFVSYGELMDNLVPVPVVIVVERSQSKKEPRTEN